KLGLVISDIDEINAILRNRPEGFRRWSEQQKVSQEMMNSRSLIYAEGDDWKRQRPLVVTALNTHHLHSYFHVIRVSTERLHRRVGQAAHTRRGRDIHPELACSQVCI